MVQTIMKASKEGDLNSTVAAADEKASMFWFSWTKGTSWQFSFQAESSSVLGECDHH